jgi:hypothetical protein
VAQNDRVDKRDDIFILRAAENILYERHDT